MASGRGCWRGGALFLLALSVAGCGATEPPSDAPENRTEAGGIELVIEDVEAPEVYLYSGTASVAAEAEGGGLWAVVPDLARPERGRIRRNDGGAGAVVALFRGPGGIVRLSSEAAELLAIGPGDAVAVDVVAVRSQVRLAEHGGGF